MKPPKTEKQSEMEPQSGSNEGFRRGFIGGFMKNRYALVALVCGAASISSAMSRPEQLQAATSEKPNSERLSARRESLLLD